MISFNRTTVFANICLAVNSLLLLWALFGAHLQVPVFLQIVGRMHPLMLHFPLVLLLASLCLELFWKNGDNALKDNVLGVAAVTSGLSAAFGLLLSKEGGYEADMLFRHQWSGITVSLLSWILFEGRTYFRSRKPVLAGLGVVLITTLVLAGHWGGVLTHGAGYLFGPLDKPTENQPVVLENALVYQHLVRPILEEKCMNCHNASKMKGELNMETEALLLKGGKNGKLWDTNAPQFGLLLRRLHLAPDAKEHMPPQGKPQLSEEELSILYHWIKNGASFTQKVLDLPENDTLRMLATQKLRASAEAPYPFAAASENTVQKLNNEYRHVAPLDLHSPALSADFYGAGAFNSQSLRELLEVKAQLVELNLSHMPLQAEDLKTVAQFTQLRRLNLAFSSSPAGILPELKSLQELRSISLSGISIKKEDLDFLKSLPHLNEVFLWNTGLADADIVALKQGLQRVRLENGFKGDTILAKLNAPIIEGEAQVFHTVAKVRLKNFIQGAVLRYTLDGSTPDSLNSPVFSGDSITIDKSCQLSAKAFLPGWVSSEVSTRNFYKTGILPDSVVLLFPPNPQYKGEGPKTLANEKIGDVDFRSNKWLGYKETPLEALLLFKTPVTMSSVSVSTLVDIGSYIMPAAEIQVWGGPDARHLVLLKKIIPKQPEKVGMPGYRTGFTCSFEPRKLACLKLIAKPVSKLPAWHPGKGERGWVFVDEVFME